MQHKLQPKEKNYRAVDYLCKLGFPILNIRCALSKLTGLAHSEIAKRLKQSRSNVTLTITGKRNNKLVQEQIASVYGVPKDLLFPGKPDTNGPAQESDLN
jgi:hypothetical protein